MCRDGETPLSNVKRRPTAPASSTNSGACATVAVERPKAARLAGQQLVMRLTLASQVAGMGGEPGFQVEDLRRSEPIGREVPDRALELRRVLGSSRPVEPGPPDGRVVRPTFET